MSHVRPDGGCADISPLHGDCALQVFKLREWLRLIIHTSIPRKEIVIRAENLVGEKKDL
jgi:hypothetical protein